MSSPISSVLITPAEAAVLARASQIEALASRSAEGTSAPGGTSFAATLQAASAAQEASGAQGSEAEATQGASPEAIPASEAEPVTGGALATVESEIASQAASSSNSASGPGATSVSPTYATYSAASASPASSVPAGSYPSTADPTSLSSAATPATSAMPATSETPAPQGASAYEPLIEQAAARNGIEPAILYGLIEQESGFNPNAQSSAGAAGLTQLMPSTAASLGVTEPLNPTQSIEGGAHLLGELLHQFHGNIQYALAAYNAGAGAVDQYGGIPPYPETEAYVTKVLANARSYQQRA